MAAKLGLKIDVDTWQGFREGVPALLQVLGERGIRASFYVALGPDHSGRAILRLFRQPGFLEKMCRTKAPALYGLRTMLYGVLLPGPLIGQAAPEILPLIAGAGHEVGLHGYDHVRWHDNCAKMGVAAVGREVDQAQGIFTNALGRPARAFAAPGWQCTMASHTVLAAQGFLYTSDTRGVAPYRPRFGGQVSPLLEIPTTLPTLDELLGFNGCGGEDFNDLILSRLKANRTQVLTVHTEVEGGPYREAFARLLDRCLDQGVAFFRLEDWAKELLAHPQEIPVAAVHWGRLPGRAGRVARQGALEVGA
ncbi:MAG: polysaccharide deacetylase family protein [Thermodesulfobacteriota bacterium]